MRWLHEKITLIGRLTACAVSIIVTFANSGVAQELMAPAAKAIDLKASTIQFVQLFKEICFENRRSLNAVRSLARSRGWRELEGPFPYRHEQFRYTALAGWDFHLEGIPYQVTINHPDGEDSRLACDMTSVGLDKAALVPQMSISFNLTVFGQNRSELNEHTRLIIPDEPDMSILCTTMLPASVSLGQCGLLSFSGSAKQENFSPK